MVAEASSIAGGIAHVLALCDHVERFAYERQGAGLDASPHLLSQAARALIARLDSVVPAETGA